MKYDHLLVRYGELTLKGSNRKKFVNQLRNNVNKSLKGLDGFVVKGKRDRMYIELEDHADINEITYRLSKIFGIKSISPVLKVEKTIDPMDTYELQRELGGTVLKQIENVSVNVKRPDHEIRVEVRLDAIYMYEEVVPGSGGLPVGTGGKTLLMLSGGIDSPVAGMEVMRRGVTIEAIHFHSPPFTSDQAKEKVIELTRILAERVGPIKLHIVPFTELQKQVNKVVHPRYTMTSTRRMMMRVADKLVHQIGALAIVNGENLGQVASQTLHSMYAINNVTSTPVLRPLLTYDKEEIIIKSKEIGTFETSIQPFEDCCTIFTPKNPVTEPNFDKVVQYESVFDFEEMINRAVENIETLEITSDYKTIKEQQTNQLINDFL